MASRFLRGWQASRVPARPVTAFPSVVFKPTSAVKSWDFACVGALRFNTRTACRWFPHQLLHTTTPSLAIKKQKFKFKAPYEQKINPQTLKTEQVDNEISAPEVVVVDHTGKLGVMPTAQGVELARSRGLQLVLVAPDAKPPVARITDFRAVLQKRVEKKTKQQKQHVDPRVARQSMKGMRIGEKIADHDMDIKLRKVREFFRKGLSVRMMVKGRVIKLRAAVFKRLGELLKDVAKPEVPTISPKKPLVVEVVFKPLGPNEPPSEDTLRRLNEAMDKMVETAASLATKPGAPVKEKKETKLKKPLEEAPVLEEESVEERIRKQRFLMKQALARKKAMRALAKGGIDPTRGSRILKKLGLDDPSIVDIGVRRGRSIDEDEDGVIDDDDDDDMDKVDLDMDTDLADLGLGDLDLEGVDLDDVGSLMGRGKPGGKSKSKRRK